MSHTLPPDFIATWTYGDGWWRMNCGFFQLCIYHVDDNNPGYRLSVGGHGDQFELKGTEMADVLTEATTIVQNLVRNAQEALFRRAQAPRARIMDEKYLIFHCPGCKAIHQIIFQGPGAWSFNGDVMKPTVSPSILVNGNPAYKHPGRPRCHSFVEGGRIRFLEDCEHELAGMVVPLEPFTWQGGEPA